MPARTLLPIGSGYEPATLRRFAQAVQARDLDGVLDVVVLPVTFADNAQACPPAERSAHLALAETRRAQIAAACAALGPARVTLAPVLTRADAQAPAAADLLTPAVDGVYVLGGDQLIAMRVLADTPLEARLAAAYAAGVVVGGNSAGAAVTARAMLGGFTEGRALPDSLRRDALALDQRGLSFGLPGVVLDQHVGERGRLGRLLNASLTLGVLGLGVDAETAAVITDETALTEVAGRSLALMVDPLTYGAAGRFAGPTHSLAARNVATHLLPPGGQGYNLKHRLPFNTSQPIPPPDLAGRVWPDLRVPAGHGPLLLASQPAERVRRRWAALSGGPGARVLIWDLDRTPAAPAALNTATGVWLTAAAPGRVLAAGPALAALHAAWRRSVAVLAADGAAAALGGTVSITPSAAPDALDEAAVREFRAEGVELQPGLSWAPSLAVEPDLLAGRRWGRLYHHLYRDPARLALGLDADTAIELTPADAWVVGAGAAVILDGRPARFSVGANGVLGAHWVLAHSLVDGERVAL